MAPRFGVVLKGRWTEQPSFLAFLGVAHFEPQLLAPLRRFPIPSQGAIHGLEVQAGAARGHQVLMHLLQGLRLRLIPSPLKRNLRPRKAPGFGFQWKTQTPRRCLRVSKPGCLRTLNESGASGCGCTESISHLRNHG